jgi:hypothetical protein
MLLPVLHVVALALFRFVFAAAAAHSPKTCPSNMQQQQQQQQQQPSWPPVTWLEDALPGFREKKGGAGVGNKNAGYRHNQQVLFDMQSRAKQAGFANALLVAATSTDAGATEDTCLEHDHVVQYGDFSCPSVQQLREECRVLTQQLAAAQQVDDEQQNKDDNDNARTRIVWHTLPHTNVLHLYAQNDDSNDTEDATFQAASQFNCLEMTSPSVAPEAGIAGYVRDRTQGPASAMACAAGTAFRNYLVNVDNVMNTTTTTNDTHSNGGNDNSDNTKLGQTKNHQINTLADIMTQLKKRIPHVRPLIRVRNGYAEATDSSLRATHAVLAEDEDAWIRLGRVGVQHDTQVTLFPTTNTTLGKKKKKNKRQRLVTQVYGSAVPIAYSLASTPAWEPLAKIVLKSCYEATLLVAVRNVARSALLELEEVKQRQQQRQQQQQQQCDDDHDEYNNLSKAKKIERLRRVYLTKVGGGVFGNDEAWILDAMRHAHVRASTYGIHLDVFIVNFGANSVHDERLVQELNDDDDDDMAHHSRQQPKQQQQQRQQ